MIRKDNNMKKKVVALGLALSLAVSTAGCGKKYVDISTYKGLEVEYQSAGTEVTDKDIYSVYWSELANYAVEVEDKNYQAKEWDKVNIDYKGIKDGEAFEGGTAQGYDLILNSGTFIPGFEEGLIGAKIGEKKDLELTFPENYSSADLAGQAVVFEVKVNKIYTLPEITDEFVSENLEGYTTAKEYMDGVKKDIEKEKEEEEAYQKRSAVWDSVIENVEVIEYPKDELEEMLTQVKEDQISYLQYYYGVTVEEYLKETGTTQEEYDKKMEENAKDALKGQLMIKEIARREKISVTDEEVEEYAKTYLEAYNVTTLEELYEQVDEEQFRKSLLQDEVLDFVVDNSNMVVAE